MKIQIVKKYFLIPIFLGFIGVTNAQKINISFQNIDLNKGGYLYISLFNSEVGYPYLDKAFKTLYVPVSAKEMVVLFENIAAGTYAINVFHDENSNKKMETNFIGIPVEGYGFSNNPRLFGPPTFNKTKFTFNGTNLTLNIKMNY